MSDLEQIGRLAKEASKELGFTALKTGIASIREPFSNEYLNANFSLNMLDIKPGKEKIFNTYLKKLIYGTSGKKNIYKNLGLTYIAPDYESISHIEKVLKNKIYVVGYVLLTSHIKKANWYIRNISIKY